MLLTHEVYGSEGIRTDRATSPFGFRLGQMRSQDLVHNGGWYNGNGERLGWGDLSPKDLQRISEEIPEGESFFILSEQDSFWNFVENVGAFGFLCSTKPEVSKPGIEYVHKFARFCITHGKIVSFSRYPSEVGSTIVIGRDTSNQLLVQVVAPY